MRYLVDTNVLSEMRKGARGSQSVRSWASSVDPFELAVSVITLGEIETGILKLARSDPQQSLVLRVYLDHVVVPSYGDRILVVDLPIALVAASFSVPNPRSTADSLIAATALVHDLTVVTRNVAHFRPMGVRLINPFSP